MRIKIIDIIIILIVMIINEIRQYIKKRVKKWKQLFN